MWTSNFKKFDVNSETFIFSINGHGKFYNIVYSASLAIASSETYCMVFQPQICIISAQSG